MSLRPSHAHSAHFPSKSACRMHHGMHARNTCMPPCMMSCTSMNKARISLPRDAQIHSAPARSTRACCSSPPPRKLTTTGPATGHRRQQPTSCQTMSNISARSGFTVGQPTPGWVGCRTMLFSRGKAGRGSAVSICWTNVLCASVEDWSSSPRPFSLPLPPSSGWNPIPLSPGPAAGRDGHGL